MCVLLQADPDVCSYVGEVGEDCYKVHYYTTIISCAFPTIKAHVRWQAFVFAVLNIGVLSPALVCRLLSTFRCKSNYNATCTELHVTASCFVGPVKSDIDAACDHLVLQ